ncbi:Smr/MutS family protein [Rubrivirga sp. S365]|uniref:Smr/MutS family protein n=1 Tax=Rubrivirga litoralis TaxID=3075598 RepID=A0ABU3BTZ8_9BACT|nr:MULTISPECIES: Smr/MutS family protein [unclassified Rubrivirga]MDT0632753.1 Smr/MutS family protein [Rubrivirga sp. F394]MDT7856942.1 Smr/MutS family protein [Rubrivirga sp. S365]
MLRPRLDDDGRTVTLDLHGARVDEALGLAHAAVVEAARRGRSTVRVVHGASTSGAGRRTIKTALHAELDAGAFAPPVTSSFRQEGAVLLGLAPDAAPLPGRLTLRDLR